MKSFEHYFNTHKRYIQIVCTSLNTLTDYKIEYEDLYQEATLKLIEMYKNKEPLDINFTRKVTRDHLINYIRKNIKGAGKLINLDIDNFLYALKKFDG